MNSSLRSSSSQDQFSSETHERWEDPPKFGGLAGLICLGVLVAAIIAMIVGTKKDKY